ncbi:hypothetical protein HYC85_005395, partial [Camellia sinensis]
TGSISNENFLLPPGRKGWPILGESLEYFSKLRNRVPEKFVTDRIHKYSSKVFRTSLLGEPMAMLCGAEGNKFLFSDEGKFVKAWFPSAITKIFPKSHNESIQESTTKVRKMLQPFLKPDALHNYVVVMDKVMKRHLETDWTGKHVKVWDVVTRYTFMMACRLLLSVEDPGQVEKLGERIGEVVEGTMSLAINFPRTAFYRAVKASEAVRKELQGMIKQRKMDLTEKRVSPTQDMLSHMLVVDDENSQFMAEFGIATTLVALLHGGTHTLNAALTFIMMYLAELPDVYHEVLRVDQNRDLIPVGQYSSMLSVYTVITKQIQRQTREIKTPLSHSLTGSKSRSEAQWLA